MRPVVRTAVVSLVCVAAVAGTQMSAVADNDRGTSQSGAGVREPGTYYANVQYSWSGTDDSGNPRTVRSSDANFTPPVCWYTAMTPDQMKAEIKRRYYDAGAEGSGTTYEFYNGENNRLEDDDHYHQGKDGSWWVLTWDEKQLDAGNYNCPYDTGYFWRKPNDPPAGRITPEILADAAYSQLKLPTRGVALSPAPDNQKVNLPTYVSFKQADTQVSVTATLTQPNGQTVSATVSAQPHSLHVDAGTQYADPGSCDYALDGATLDSATADCNITYRRASAGTYPMTAAMTWKVWWTPTATSQPQGDGTPMPDGFSDFPQPVTVQEIQAVNR